jgi:hypothetical protein
MNKTQSQTKRGELFKCNLDEYNKQTAEEKKRFLLVFFEQEVYAYKLDYLLGEVAEFWPGFFLEPCANGYIAVPIAADT